MNRPSPDDMLRIATATKQAEIQALQGVIKKLHKDIEEQDVEISKLRNERTELQKEVKKRKMIADENWEHYDMMKDEYEKLEEENKELKKKLDILYHYV